MTDLPILPGIHRYSLLPKEFRAIQWDPSDYDQRISTYLFVATEFNNRDGLALTNQYISPEDGSLLLEWENEDGTRSPELVVPPGYFLVVDEGTAESFSPEEFTAAFQHESVIDTSEQPLLPGLGYLR